MLTRIPSPKLSYQVKMEWIESDLLKGNAAGEDARRPLTVIVPEGAADRRFAVYYCLAPWTNAGRTQAQWEPFKESLIDRVERLTASGQIKPAIFVCPDLYTGFGGSQYINSQYFGPHGDHVVHELIPYIEKNYPVLPGPLSRGVFGRSSGGFGALRLAMDYPGTFAAVACHSGDMGFDLLYRRDLVDLCYALARYSGDPKAYLKALQAAPKIDGKSIHTLMLLGMAAFYSPNDKSGYDLPIDVFTGELKLDVWQQWASQDPVWMIDETKNQEALRALALLYIDCGNRDQYHLHFGARQLRRKLERYGIAHKGLEFDDNHSGTAYRYDVSLPMMDEVLRHHT
ncbi:MAG: esterase [Proteobacteria bacterium]|nr:MAG: esterase [Pseudomonadota bacterium]